MIFSDLRSLGVIYYQHFVRSEDDGTQRGAFRASRGWAGITTHVEDGPLLEQYKAIPLTMKVVGKQKLSTSTPSMLFAYNL